MYELKSICIHICLYVYVHDYVDVFSQHPIPKYLFDTFWGGNQPAYMLCEGLIPFARHFIAVNPLRTRTMQTEHRTCQSVLGRSPVHRSDFVWKFMELSIDFQAPKPPCSERRRATLGKLQKTGQLHEHTQTTPNMAPCCHNLAVIHILGSKRRILVTTSRTSNDAGCALRYTGEAPPTTGTNWITCQGLTAGSSTTKLDLRSETSHRPIKIRMQKTN